MIPPFQGSHCLRNDIYFTSQLNASCKCKFDALTLIENVPILNKLNT